MAAKKGSSKIEALTALPGVGAATAKKLVSAKIDTVGKLASVGVKKIEDAGISAAVAKKISAAAKAADKVTGAAKNTATKAKSASKTSAKKATAVAKKTATKAQGKAKGAAGKAKAVANKTVAKAKDATSMAVPSKKSDDGRKGATLKVPRSVRDMPWFNKK